MSLSQISQDLCLSSRRATVWFEIASFALCTASLLLSEVVVNNLASYLLANEAYLHLVVLFVFSGISVGNLIQLTPALRTKVPRSAWIVFAGGCLFAGYFGCLRSPDSIPVFAALSFVGFGAYLSASYAELQLKQLVIGFSLGGLSITAALALLYAHMAPILPEISIGLLVAGLMKPKQSKSLLASFSLMALVIFVLPQMLTDAKSATVRSVPALREAERIGDPIYHPLFRTDLFRVADGSTVIVTNGRRFATVIPKNDYLAEVQNSTLSKPSHDFPYAFTRPKKVLVIGSGEGANLISAEKFGASSVTAVDINPNVISLMTGSLAEASGGIYLRPNVHAVVDEGRHFIETSTELFDLITFQGVQTGSRGHLISTALVESFLLTRESILSSWHHLTPEGCLWFDEYRWPILSESRQTKRSTLMELVYKMAKAHLPIESFDRHAYFIEYLQDKDNIKGVNREAREGLLICKEKIQIQRANAEVMQFVNQMTRELKPDSASSNDLPEITDQHPYVLTRHKVFQQLRLGITLILIVFCIWSLVSYRRVAKSPEANMALFFIGCGFILSISSFVGLGGLVVGLPQLSPTVVFVAVYFFGLIGGLLALKTKSAYSGAALVFLVLYTICFSAGFDFFSEQMLNSSNLTRRALCFLLILAPFAIACEIPYIWLLNAREGTKRSVAYAFENLGTLTGVPIGIFLQIEFGYKATLMAAGSAYFLAFLFSFPSPSPKIRKWLWLICAIGSVVGVVAVWRGS